MTRFLEAPGKTRPATAEDEAYLERLQPLLEDCALAEELFTEDELEEAANEYRKTQDQTEG